MNAEAVSVRWVQHDLQFTFTARTSRSTLTVKPTWLLRYDFPERETPVFAEANVLEGLSPENPGEFAASLNEYVRIMVSGHLPDRQFWEKNPALLFAHEMAMNARKGPDIIWTPDSDFSRGRAKIPINGLVWMDNISAMKRQALEKIKAGFSCVKIKVGALDFEEELGLLRELREEFSPSDLTLRIDANGGFSGKNPLEKLKRLSELDIHSIEQPIVAGRQEEMAAVCANSPVSVALDEELIGVKSREEKTRLLEAIKPAFIILKPALIGGLTEADEWVEEAEKKNIGWWATSALESNIGLNAIAHWVFSKRPLVPQGLGTGQLYANNFDSPMEVNRGALEYLPGRSWNLRHLAPLWKP